MNIYGLTYAQLENYLTSIGEKKSKAPMIIGVSIVILVIITIMICMAIIYLKNSIVKILQVM